MAGRSFSRVELERRCRTLETHVRRCKYASEQELDAYRPGGPDNPDRRGLWGLIRWHAQLVRFCGREEAHEGDRAAADGEVLDALRGESLSVTLVEPRPAEAPAALEVHPKGLSALMECHQRDALLGWLGLRAIALREALTPDDLELSGRVQEEIAHQYALLAWIVTHPGPALPYEFGDRRPVPPAWALALSPHDYMRIAQAHSVVNAQRLGALDTLVAKDSAPGEAPIRPSWSVFVGELAVKMQTPADVLMRDHTLASLLATVRAHSASERAASKAAERAAERAA